MSPIEIEGKMPTNLFKVQRLFYALALRSIQNWNPLRVVVLWTRVFFCPLCLQVFLKLILGCYFNAIASQYWKCFNTERWGKSHSLCISNIIYQQVKLKYAWQFVNNLGKMLTIVLIWNKTKKSNLTWFNGMLKIWAQVDSCSHLTFWSLNNLVS